jgi:hypothetical protein
VGCQTWPFEVEVDGDADVLLVPFTGGAWDGAEVVEDNFTGDFVPLVYTGEVDG